MTKEPQTTGRLLVAKDSFSHEYEGAQISFVMWQTKVREGHPMLRGIEHLFEPCHADYEWESATAAPGERRG